MSPAARGAPPNANDVAERLLRVLAGGGGRDLRVDAAYVFGSVARGEARSGSDIDVALLLDRDLSLAEELRLRAALAEALESKALDLVLFRSAPPVLRFEVKRDGIRFFARDDAAMDTLEGRWAMEYMDTAYMRRLQQDLAREAARR